MRFRMFDKDDPILIRWLTATVVTATTITDRVFAVRRVRHPFQIDQAEIWNAALAGAVAITGSIVPQGTGLLTPVTLTIDAAAEKFKSTVAFKAFLAGIEVEKAATTANVFTAAHVITASKFGAIRVQMDNAGTVTTKVVSATQAYDTAAAALAALPDADSGKIAIGRIEIANNAGDWTANTDDLTNGSDVTTATFTGNGRITPFLDAGAPLIRTLVEPTTVKQNGNTNDLIVLLYTTDGTGALTNGQVGIRYRIRGGQGDR